MCRLLCGYRKNPFLYCVDAPGRRIANSLTAASADVSRNPKLATLKPQHYEILQSLPTYGAMYIPISVDKIPFYSEGFVVRFLKSDQTTWVANFKTGLSNLVKIFEFPDLNRIVVFAYGTCYIINPEIESAISAFGFGFTNVHDTKENILLAVGQTDMTIIDIVSDSFWNSKRISWDGFAEIKFENEFITGLACQPTFESEEWKEFSFNYKTKELKGGTYYL